mmetsp:Transcript_19462/g.39855  ORF Transcript_19462/g.39855 Transcript_19462/m.39855 type:complete len:342 (+) Transcript_19462:756-1781(+)
MLLLPPTPLRNLHTPVLPDIRPIQPICIWRLQHRSLRLVQILIKLLRPHRRPARTGISLKIRPPIRHRRRRKPIQSTPPLHVRIPTHRSVHRPFRKQHHIPRLGRRLNDVFLMHQPIHHPLGHFEIRLMTPGNDAEPPVSGIVIHQHDIAPQQRRPYLPVVTRVRQVGIVLSRRAIHRPPVQLKPLPSLIVHQHEGKVVQSISLPQQAVEEGNQLGMRQNRLEDARFDLPPFEDAPQIDAGGAGAVHGRASDGVAEGGVGARDGGGEVRVDGGVAGGDFGGGEDVADDEVAVEVEEVAVGFGHGGGDGWWRLLLLLLLLLLLDVVVVVGSGHAGEGLVVGE